MAAPQGKIVVVLGVNPSGVLRTLELDASDFLKVALASPSTLDTHLYGYDPTTWRPLLVDASGRAIIVGTGTSGRVPTTIAEELPAGTQNIGDVDVVSSALPSGAATSANQSTEITALQLIDDLRNALASVATDKLRASIVDALVAGTARIGSVGEEGYYNGAWQKSPLLLGYSARVFRTITNLNLAGGTEINNDTAVPAGEIWVITHLVIAVGSTTITGLQARFIDGVSGAAAILVDVPAPANGVWYDRQGYWIMQENDYLAVRTATGTAGDDVFLRGIGFRVDLDQ